MTTTAPRLLARPRVFLALALAGMVALAWAYLVWMALEMGRAGEVGCYHCAAMPGMGSSAATYFAWLVAMWSVMMLAMMLPTTVPMLVLHGRIQRVRGGGAGDGSAVSTLHLAGGYFVVWTGFAVLASGLQWLCERGAILTPVMGEIRSPLVGGLVLAGAGLFQLSPLKQACLNRCRTPLGYFMTRWRDGRRGALVMGFEHGLSCLGCCWALMLVMFVAGVMNVLWMVGLTVFMMLEKLVPRGEWLARAAGLGLVAAGLYVAVG